MLTGKGLESKIYKELLQPASLQMRKRFDRHFTEYIQMISKHMEKTAHHHLSSREKIKMMIYL